MRAIVDTDISDAEITDLITEVDAFIDLMAASAGATVKQAISRTWTAYRCMLKDPSSEKLGEWSGDRAEALRQMWAQVELFLGSGAGGVNISVGRDFP